MPDVGKGSFTKAHRSSSAHGHSWPKGSITVRITLSPEGEPQVPLPLAWVLAVARDFGIRPEDLELEIVELTASHLRLRPVRPRSS